MNNSNRSQSRWQEFGTNVVCYGAWIVLSGLGLWIALEMLATMPTITLRFNLSAWSASLWNKVATMVILLLWLILVMALEPYLRNGMEKQTLRQRIIQVAIIEGVMLGLVEGIQLFM